MLVAEPFFLKLFFFQQQISADVSHPGFLAGSDKFDLLEIKRLSHLELQLGH